MAVFKAAFILNSGGAERLEVDLEGVYLFVRRNLNDLISKTEQRIIKRKIRKLKNNARSNASGR